MFTLQTLPASDELFDDGAGKMAGFSLHAGVAARADERKKLERLCRYISRPAVSEQRLSLTPNGNVRYQLKTPYRDGTTHVIFQPLDFIARLAALVRRDYRAALIDEFQDTDPVQYSIFRRLYAGQPACGLYLIGDPKQAIYAFRGADLHTYLRARNTAASRFTLSANYRSRQELLDALNAALGPDGWTTARPWRASR